MNFCLTKGVVLEYHSDQNILRIHYSFFVVTLLSAWQWGHSVPEAFLVVGALCLAVLNLYSGRSLSERLLNGCKTLPLPTFSLTLVCLGLARDTITTTDEVAVVPEQPLARRVAAALGGVVTTLAAVVVLEVISAVVQVSPFVRSLILLLQYAHLAVGMTALLPVVPLEAGVLFRECLGHFKPTINDPRLSRYVPINSASSKVINKSENDTFPLKIGQYVNGLLVVAGIILGILPMIATGVMLLGFGLQSLLRAAIARAATGMSVAQVMRPASMVDVLSHGMTVATALRVTTRSFQEVFPVVHAHMVIGLVDRTTLLRSLASLGEEYITGIMDRGFNTVDEDVPLTKLLARDVASENDRPLIVTGVNKEFAGLLLVKSVMDTLIVEDLKTQHRERDSQLGPDNSSEEDPF